MKKGDVVFNEWHGIRRYGIVTKTWVKENQNIPVPWTYATVDWFDDEPYQNVVANTNRLRNDGTDVELREYRIDKLKKINLEREMATFRKIKRMMNVYATSREF